MEYLEGETLAARVSRGALPAKELWRYAAEIANALAEAHRGGVLHRDLKPSNIMLTKSGIKLLDFGLAKLPQLEGVPSGVSGGLAVTAIEDLTLPGVVLGTLPYMPPEQLEGRETDARSDIFSFGSVVYEMATGRTPFADDTAAGVIAAILKRDPPPISTFRSEPELFCQGLDRIILRCLAKDPAQRWQTASDLAISLKWVAEAGQPEPTGRRKLRFIAWPHLVWIAAALAVIGALIAGVAQFRKPQPELGVLRFAITPPDKALFGTQSSFAISETGRLAFVAISEGKQLLWVQPLDSLTAQALPGTDDASYPFWSPDSHSIGFFAQRKLKTIQIAGGQPQIVCRRPRRSWRHVEPRWHHSVCAEHR